MTDKQIIDGVDMSGCGFLIVSNDKQLCRCIKSDLFGGIEFVENAKNGNCKDNPNCYYKQLKRAKNQIVDLNKMVETKEQECEKLRKQLGRKEENYQKLLSKSNKYIHNLIDENVRDISNLARQLDELEAENEKLKEQVKKEIEASQKWYQLHTDEHFTKLKLEQTLIEIKEIAEYELNNLTDSTIHGGRYLEILDKISECGAENENS